MSPRGGADVARFSSRGRQVPSCAVMQPQQSRRPPPAGPSPQGSVGAMTERGPAEWTATRAAVVRNAAGIGIATGAYALSFGAVATAAGLSVLQTCVLSLAMFTGASQYALVGVLGSGGGGAAAAATALLLGTRNAFYGLRLSSLLGVARRPPTRRRAAGHRREHCHEPRPRQPARQPSRFLGHGCQRLRALEPRDAPRRTGSARAVQPACRGARRRRAGGVPRAPGPTRAEQVGCSAWPSSPRSSPWRACRSSPWVARCSSRRSSPSSWAR